MQSTVQCNQINVKRYLGDLGEDPVHGVLPGVEVQLGLGQHVAPELCELEAEEEVGEVDLAEHVHQVQHLAEHELHEVGASSRWPAIWTR